ncbi:MAG TPA: TetR/AcrR family transcriptional regulator C-terminal domain-containing protein [Pseudonocardiaceae bacterium]|nr:TetR/AcrR family transcriptional regulator C-terminal domain-containing protein [Pseudonocardiaceae bacterium]
MAITRDDVVRTALRLLDEVGLEGLTLRRLGGELGVSAATLYWHVLDKRALLDLVAEAIVAEHRPPVRPAPGQPWWEWLTASAWAQYRALVDHRDAALVVAGNRPTEHSLPAVEQIVGSLVEVGFPATEALTSILTIGHFVIGSALEHQAEAARGATTGTDAALASRIRTAGDLPNLAAAVRTGAPPDPDSTFRHGLTLIMGGLRARHVELTGTLTARA